MKEQTFEEACRRYLVWLEKEISSAATGRDLSESQVRPDGVFFLGTARTRKRGRRDGAR